MHTYGVYQFERMIALFSKTLHKLFLISFHVQVTFLEFVTTKMTGNTS